MDQHLDQPIQQAQATFLSNSTLGLNKWWRWVVGIILILVFWQGIGIIPLIVACEYLNNTGMSQFTCEDLDITGDSFIPEYLLSNYAFIIGIIGIWITVKLVHKKTLTHVVTGRRTFDYNRVLYAIWVGIIISGFLLALDRLFFHSDIVFRSPNIWEYVTFFLFAIVLTPYQAGLEEILFRGYLLQGISLLTKNKIFLVSSSAFLFALVHLSNPEPYQYGFGPYLTHLFIVGIFLSLLTLFDGGIELAVGYHAVNNLWVALIVNNEVTSMPTPSLFVIPIDNYVFFPDTPVQLITLVIIFLVFNRKYQWIDLSKLL